MSSHARPADFALLGFLGLLWGLSFLFVSVAVETIPPLTLAAGRIVLAALIMWGVVLAAGLKASLGARQWVLYAGIGLLGNAAPFVLIGWGQARIASGTAAILMATVPIFTLALTHVFTSDDRADLGKGMGMLLGLAGILVLTGGEALAGLDAHVWGQIAVVGGALSYAAANLLAGRAAAMPPRVSAAAVLSCGVFWSLPVSVAVDLPWTLTPSALSLGAALALGVFSTALGLLVFFRLLARTRPTFVASVNYVVPCVGVLWGALLLGESVSPRALVAMALVLAGIAALGLDKARWSALGAWAFGRKPPV